MTKKRICTLTFALLLFVSTAVWASTPFIQGGVSGIELCPQFICHAAIFVGGFGGTLGNNTQAQGTISTAMHHTPLPNFGDPDATITDGSWELKTLFRRVGGDVVIGSIHANDNNTFDVAATLRVTTNNGAGFVQFIGLLDHRFTIPRFSGALINVP